jgi:hypothetical protein
MGSGGSLRPQQLHLSLEVKAVGSAEFARLVISSVVSVHVTANNSLIVWQGIYSARRSR